MMILYLYITIFTIYFIILAAVSFKQVRKFRDKYTPKDANLCIVLYATGKSDTFENLLKQLKNQAYPKQNYTIYAILDKCVDIPEVTLQSDLNVNVVNVDNLEPIGKSQAFSIIADKLHDVENLDAYVFLDAKHYVDSDFLSNINFYLTKYDVFNPMTNYLPQDGSLNFWQNVKLAYSRYITKFMLITRTKMGLTNIINTDAFIIKKDLLNKMASFDFRDIMSEVQYTLKLAEEGYKVALLDDLKVYTSIEKFDFRIPSLYKRVALSISNIFKPHTLIAREFLFSLLAPNWLTYIVSYILFIILSGSSTIVITASVFAMALATSLYNAKLYNKEYLYLFMYPVLSIARLIYNFPLIRGIRNMIKQTTRKHNIETMATNIIVSDGLHDYTCQMELISDDGLARITFINKGKKYTTKNQHIRMIDAMREFASKLSDYGLTLKACQCCKYFQPIVDGSTNMVKGCCKCDFQGRTPGDIIPTLIWNTCPKFEENNVVNLF